MGLFGRDESLRVLADAAAAARDGRGGIVMVRADPGLGLTALLDAHLLAVRDAGLPAYRIPVLPPNGRTSLSSGAPNWTGPAVVVIDDLHRADDATLLALHEVAEELHEHPLLVVAGRHRGADPARFDRLDRLGTVHDLHPLEDDAVQALLAESEEAPPPESVLRLAEDAGGNPWLLSRITENDRAATITAWATELAGDDAALLRFAAILDELASVDELAAVSGFTPADVLAGIARLAATGLVGETGRLRHPLVCRDVAAASTGLRGPVARTLATRGAEPETVAAQLAHVPIDAWTLEWLDENAEQLATRPTPQILDLLDRAVSGLRPGNPSLHPLRAALTEAYLWSGKRDEARRVAEASLAARPDLRIRRRLRAARALTYLIELDPDNAIAELDQERAEGDLTGMLAGIDAQAHLMAGDLDGAARAMELAAPAAEQDPVVEIYLLITQAIIHSITRDLTGALKLLDRAGALLDIAANDPAQRLVWHIMRAAVQNLRHERAALETVEEARQGARELGGGLQVWLHIVAALASFNTGNWDQALAEIGTATAMPKQYGMARPLHAVAVMILVHRGELAKARSHAEHIENPTGSGLSVFYDQIIALARALMAGAEGNSERALGIVRNLADGDIGVHTGHSVGTVGVPIVRIAVDGGDQELAAQLVTQMRRWNAGESGTERAALRYCKGLVDSDVEELLAAAQEFADEGNLISAGRAAEDAAKILAASGRSADARAPYQEAIDHYNALTATGAVSQADAALRAFGVRRGATGRRRRPKHGWESLTSAERRVADLVAQGLTNREAAERLYVSVRTVDSHVSKVLGKLGYSSRVELALRYEQRD